MPTKAGQVQFSRQRSLRELLWSAEEQIVLFWDRENTTREQSIEVVDSNIRWYNEKRVKISLGSLSPIEYRVNLGLAA